MAKKKKFAIVIYILQRKKLGAEQELFSLKQTSEICKIDVEALVEVQENIIKNITEAIEALKKL